MKTMFFEWLWWQVESCGMDEDEYYHQLVLLLLVRIEHWPRPTWRSRKK